ncbi:sigma-70 family RNA polymerase sigma factor [Paraflavitalea sp. CAU 1676]|uniref:RNA polymerase sigma factor n=1 Tax=Paraflavitalea sp. CAU 1676 TaxID=3032598 RepID=UPI0023DA19A0|nr:sigma-70 family RNA polymerase sigma factor [Paraflavitalea sp. CAU 1676]MDF2189606.1 sigma-70 family RNA polymerase sigma factor [Paraflavitalea sp. CAU 1676]
MTPKFQDNTYWMLSFREGKHDAFRKVFNEHHRSLYYLATKMGLEREEAEDIVSDSFTKLWHGRSSFSNEEHIKGFLVTTTRNACLNLVSQKKRRHLSHNELSYILADHEEDFFRKMVESELLRKLYPHIEQLPKKCKAVFKQIYLEGASTEEAAERLGISTRNVLNQKARAIQLLKGKLLLLLLICSFLHIYNVVTAENTSNKSLHQAFFKKSEKSFCQKAHTRCLYGCTR